MAWSPFKLHWQCASVICDGYPAEGSRVFGTALVMGRVMRDASDELVE